MQSARDINGFTRFLAVGVVAVGLATGCTPPGPAALLKGERLLGENKTAEAVAAFEEAVRIMPGTAQAWNHLGLGYHRQGDVAKAANAYQRALELDRNLAVARFNLGSLYLESGNNQSAIDAFTTFCTLQPLVGEGWLRLGQAQVALATATPGPTDRQRLAEAARRNLEHAPESAEKANAMGQVLALRGKYREAVAEFTRALSLQPDLASAVLNQAVALQQSGDRRGALQRYRDYLKIQPDAPHSAGVEALATQLDRELNPVAVLPAVVASNQPPPALVRTAAPPVIVAVQPKPTPSTTKPVPTTNAPPVAVKPPVASNVVAQPTIKPPEKTNAAPVAPPTPLTTVTLAEEAPIKPAVDGPRPSSTAELAAKPTPLPQEANLSGLTNPTSQPTSTEDRSKNSGFLKKLNPATWFSGKDKSAKPQAAAKLPPPTIVEPGSTNPPTPAPPPVFVPPPKPVYPRYSYPIRTAPPAGNRAEAEKVFASAVEEHRAGREVTAAAGYKQALLLDPAYFEAHYNLAMALAGTPASAEALNHAETAVVLYPQSSAARLQFAQLLDRAGHPTDAAIELEKIIAAEPANVNAHLTVANLFAQRLGEPAKARTHYLKVLELDPKNSQANAIRFWLSTPAM